MIQKERVGRGGGGDEMRNDGGEVFATAGMVVLEENTCRFDFGFRF